MVDGLADGGDGRQHHEAHANGRHGHGYQENHEDRQLNAQVHQWAFYQDRLERLWFCAPGKTKTAQDGTVVVQMQQTRDRQAVGDPAEEPADVFVKQLTAAELKEYRSVCQREREAEAVAPDHASAR